MGKVRALRARVHRAAVRPAGAAAGGPAAPARDSAAPKVSAGGAGTADPLGSDIFTGTKIDPSTLVQTLQPKLEPESRCVGSFRRGVDPKVVLPKKDKRRLRREQWLQKVEALKQAEREQQAARKRRATVVVGDLQPLRDALPELLQLEASARGPHRRRPSSKPRPTELSRMSTAQRQQLLEEERTHFRELLASSVYRACPLLAIREQLQGQVL
ncbi:ribosome biogenesis protein SLX9 homolog isoform X2 [Suncus etruscus]|uniref:ribosome biogenesis protein SLX9 homolog isoform X2 n=1 Tax=Suncus etruscus TaxID=109475 RepID=UPI00210F6E26|nr:ribosome biogenesis protein SLX9 homolog isoform X2 [Suncus etruscus]